MRTIAFAFATVLLSLVFIVEGPTRGRVPFQGDSEALIVASLERSRQTDHPRVDGVTTFMNRPDGRPYLSQFGLQKRLLAGLLTVNGDLERFLELAWAGFGILTALVLAWWIAFESERSGPVTAAVVLVLVALSPWVAAFSTVLYWSSFLFYLPFVVVWTARSGPAESQRWLGPVVLGLVAAKSLCGYEYLSNIVASVGVAAVWRDLEDGSDVAGALRRAFRLCLWAVGGFAVAVAAHVLAAAALAGSLAGGFAIFLERATARTVGDDLHRPISILADLKTWLLYFAIRVLPHVRQAALVLVVAGSAVFVRRRRSAAGRQALAIGLPLAMMASLSWNLLAWGHMRYHFHINAITFFIPFNLVGFLLIGGAVAEALSALVTRRRQIVEMLIAEENRQRTAPAKLRKGIQQHVEWLRKGARRQQAR